MAVLNFQTVDFVWAERKQERVFLHQQHRRLAADSARQRR